MTDDLAAFLAARLDEDEAAARAAASIAGPGWKAETYWPGDESRTRTCVRSKDGAFLGEFGDTPDYPDMAAHVARHDPARVLREVEAGRAILDLHVQVIPATGYEKGNALCTSCGGFDEDDAYFAVEWPCATVRTLAAVYSDHPHYREEWKPEVKERGVNRG